MCIDHLMAEINLPLSISYQTEGSTSVGDVIEALKATDTIVKETVSLLPSFVDGLNIEQSTLNVQKLTQQSPLREVFLVTLVVTYQDDLQKEVPQLLEDILKVQVTDKYDSLVTVIFMIIIFYGANFAIEALKRAITDSKPKRVFKSMLTLLAKETGKSEADILAILEAKFSQPNAAKRLVQNAKKFFLPSQKDKNAPIHIDRDLIDSETVREIPYAGAQENNSDFDRYTPHEGVELELHAMDRDKSKTGWAAVVREVTDKRLKMKIVEPLSIKDFWGRDNVKADVVVVSKLTAAGYVPAEVQVRAILD